MSRRATLAARLELLDLLRRPVLLVLVVVVPFFFITRSITRTEPIPRRVGLPGGGDVVATMRDIHGATMVTITVAFLAGLCGAFVMRSARDVDRRLVLAGFRPAETVAARGVVLAVVTAAVLAVSLAVTGLSFDPASWPVFIAGNLLAGLTYACIGALAGALLGQLGSTYLVLFAAMLGVGILQNPMFGDGTPGGLALALPDHGAARIVIAGALGSDFDAWAEVALAGAWLAGLAACVAALLARLVRSGA